ncbi:hypothetical protein C1C91_23415 (plasmid) [Aeromonas caviae]|uniref:Uncharacterized protein n=1 Tax=Aeromonas caviae TaxID=648 RepID=A0A7D5UKU7_AERCA|nr:hypothetical protein [Aeromonas caviae]QLI60521.1 hypothetical protein C1C91_23415 [Aeromonas caviae]
MFEMLSFGSGRYWGGWYAPDDKNHFPGLRDKKTISCRWRCIVGWPVWGCKCTPRLAAELEEKNEPADSTVGIS